MKNILNTGIWLLALLAMGFSANAQGDSSEAPKGRIWGYSFGDFIYKAQGDTLYWGKTEYAALKKNTIGANLRRLYLGYDYKITAHFTAKVLMEGNAGTLTSDGRFGMAIKLGYLEWSDFLAFIPNSTAQIGLVPTPIFAFPEKAWGYRSVEKEAMDLRGLGRSVDQGASLTGDFNQNKTAGFTLLIGNGSGNKPGVDNHLEYNASVYRKLWNNQVTLEFMGDYLRKNENERTALFRGFLSFERPNFTFGLEVLQAYTKEKVSGQFAEVDPMIISVFFSNHLGLLGENWRSFVRYDFFDPSTKYNPEGIYSSPSQHYNEHSLWLGLHYKLKGKVNIMPNVIVNKYESKNERVVERKSDIVPRMTLYFLFGD